MIIIREKTKIKEGISVAYPPKPEILTVRMVRKPATFQSLLGPSAKERCTVQQINYFDSGLWEKFKEDMWLFQIRGWEKLGGTVSPGLFGVIKCVGPKSAGDPPIYVNPEGYNYPRYAGFAI